ncbi:MAG TPA: DUF2304 domain-containing protein [Candidatus Omnitrophota bacterium]|nr:DUF2304 domain-containing protein [Candidatus Omnitrophota bacterium]HPN87899.1 DUF2304 domain-containing protein [Candidatus Omnitrophota bacterium]
MSVKILALGFGLVILFSVLELIRKEKLTFKYALGWLVIGIVAIFSSIFETVIFKTASFLGFKLPSNFIFFSLLSVFILFSLLLTVFLCQQNNRNDLMAQKIGILELEIEKLKRKINKE